jgi:hypothetical protein
MPLFQLGIIEFQQTSCNGIFHLRGSPLACPAWVVEKLVPRLFESWCSLSVFPHVYCAALYWVQLSNSLTFRWVLSLLGAFQAHARLALSAMRPCGDHA